MYSSYVHLVDKKGSGVTGGASVAGAWRQRDLTDEIADTGGVCTLAANQFTLDAGTYRIFASTPIFRAQHQSRLYNVTDASMELLGVNAWNENAAPEAETHGFIFGRFTIAAQKTFEVQYRVSGNDADGLGEDHNWGDNIYTVVELWKET